MEREMITIPKGGRPVKNPPQDILQLQPTMTQAELAVHYGVSVSTIARWVRKARHAAEQTS